MRALIVATALVAAVVAYKPVDMPCVTWEPLTSYENTDPTDLFVAAYTWVIGNSWGQCVEKGDIFPCFASTTGTWGHHDYQAVDIPQDYCRTNVNGSVYLANNMYVPKKGPKWDTWKWKLAQTGGKVPDNAIRFGGSVMARSTANPSGMCCGKGFTGWAVGQKDGTFGQVHFTIQNTPVTTTTFEVAICKAYIPTPAPTTPAPPTPVPPTNAPVTPAPPTPAPTTAAPPTLPPNNRPYIRFGNAIPADGSVDATISQGSLSYTWSDYSFAKFSGWVEEFSDGFGNITIYENNGGTRGKVLLTREIPLTPGPLVVVVRGSWPPNNYNSVETIAASYVPPVVDSGVRLFNLSPDTASAGLKADGTTLVDHVDYSLGSVWAPVEVESMTFEVFDDKTGKTLATQTTTPPDPPFVFTLFLLGLSNATAGSTYATQAVPLIDAPESS